MIADVLLAGVAAGLPPVGLGDVAELMTRVDRKYVVPVSTMARLAAELGDGFAVLEIGGRRQFRYSSTYFDTPDLLTYRHHRQGRRNRFKIRVRTYLDGGGRFLEVKLSGAGKNTDKHRIPYDDGPRGVLSSKAMEFVSDTLLSGLRVFPPNGLEPVIATDYRRITLVDRLGQARLTCDSGLICRDGTGVVRARGDYVLVESKSEAGYGRADGILRDMGARPVSISKYCLGVARLRDMSANRWNGVLRRYFGD
ncbi:polyphosphate polymerase domain-containing protein [Streptosporangium sp. KLBMP 9127]|nr:polyphosphate polymerase domain-containing protein [Streptosporangium sp. KLBMP 9127]